jgi:hypothetical protein
VGPGRPFRYERVGDRKIAAKLKRAAEGAKLFGYLAHIDIAYGDLAADLVLKDGDTRGVSRGFFTRSVDSAPKEVLSYGPPSLSMSQA